MLKNLALVASLGANLVLLALALLGSGTTAANISAASSTELAARRSDDPAAYYRALKTLGLDDHEAQLLLGAQFEARAMGKLRPPPDRYWEPRQAELAKHGQEVAAAQAVVRSELEAALGDRAARAPELARLFRPLGPRFDFLSTNEQVALQQWRLRHAPDVAPNDIRAAARTPGAARASNELSQLRGVLPASAAFEVAVRDSALAEQLRSSGAKLNEDEFRETYAALADAEPARDVEAQLALRRRMRSRLGADRFDRVWAIQDPLAAVVRDAGRERGLDDADALRAYGVLNASQERLTQLAASGDLKSERTVTAAQAIARDEELELAHVVGEESARAILNARSAYFVALSRAVPAGTPRPTQ